MIKVILGLVLAVVLAGLAFGMQTPSAYAIKTINEPTGGDCTSIGMWTSSTNTCTLSNETNDGIVIGDNNIVLDGNGHTISGTSGNGVLVQIKQGVTIKNLKIQNFGTGINVDNSINTILSGNTISNSQGAGISSTSSNNLVLTNNVLSNNNGGITVSGTPGTTLTSNTVSNDKGSVAILISGSSNTVLTSNTVTNNGGAGIETVSGSDGSTLTGNTVSGNGGIGIYIVSSNNIVTKNTISNNGNTGIYVSAGGTQITHNTISNNLHGIDSGYASTVYDNIISGNKLGIAAGGGSFYNNNLINNAVQVSGAFGSTFSLNPPTGGNYWSDYSTSAQGCGDSNYDNFCDKPYPFSGGTVGVVDNYPWTIQNGWHTVITTGGNITTTVVGNATSKSVSYSASATQDSSPVSVSCTPSSGSLFQIGKTMVTCTASTGVKASFAVTLQQQDTVSPIVTVPSNQVVTATSSSGAIVNYPTATATDNVGVTNGPTCTPSSGSLFSIGNTTVTCTASDAAGNIGKATFVVNVQSTQSQQSSATIIPPILKTIAGQWSVGTISDYDFLQSVQYLINQGTMSVSHTSATPSSLPIPTWIKNTAGLWAQGSVDDNAFASGIQYLFANGILPVQVNGVPGPISQSNVPSQSITVSTDRSSYSSGDRIYFSGTISNTDPSSVTLLIYNPSNTFVLLASGIADSTHHFQIVVDTGVSDNLQKFSLAGTYTATAFTTDKTNGATTSFAFSPTNTPVVPPPSTNTLTAATDRSSYSAGDSIIVSGTVNQINSVNPQQPVTIQTYDIHHELVRIDQAVPSPNGQYSIAVPAHGPMWQSTGIYTLKIQYDQQSSASELTFYFDAGTLPTPIPQSQVNVDILAGAGSSANAACVTANNCFSPNPINVSPGTTVIWKNTDTVSHTITSGHVTDDNTGSLFDSGLVKSGNTFQFTFTTAGAYDYLCTVHPWMIGKVVVGQGEKNSVPTITPTGLSATVISPTQINLSWFAPTQNYGKTIVGYKIESTSNGVFNTNSTSTTYSVIGLKTGVPYTYRVSAIYSDGTTTDPSNTITVIPSSTSTISPTPQSTSTSVFTPTQQDLNNINQARTNQAIAAEVNIGNDKTETKSIDSSVSVQTTSSTSDSLGVKVSAPDQTGPKVIVFNLNATTINVANLKDLGVEYDGKPISPAPNMDAILHAKSTDNPSFAIVVTQSGVQVMVLVPHFSTHTITLTNMSKVIPTVPEFPFAMLALIIAIFSVVLISKIKSVRNLHTVFQS